MSTLTGLSLFSNIGVAEAYFEDLGIQVAVANEIDEKRAKLYQHLYPKTDLVIGDITNKTKFQEIIEKSKRAGVDFIISTPPCQGMSTAGKKDPKDPRNQLITYAIEIIKELKPKFVFMENVPQQLRTKIYYGSGETLIPDYVKEELTNLYIINESVVNAASHGVPQSRERSIFLMVRKDLNFKWEFPTPMGKLITLREAIGHLPMVDPIIQEYNKKAKEDKLLEIFPNFYENQIKAAEVSKWHKPPVHKLRHVTIMKYTPEGKSAFENPNHYPKKNNGERISGHNNTYKRQWWDKPAYTITTYNGAICSYDNVHPGRPIGHDRNGEVIYSDPRVLTIYELLIVSSLPGNWNLPEWANESLIRHGIGEGIPPLLVKKIMQSLLSRI